LDRFEEEEQRKMPAISAAATAEEAADDDDINNGASTSTAAMPMQKEQQQNQNHHSTTTSIANNSSTTQMNSRRMNGPIRLALPEEEDENGGIDVKKASGRTGGAGAVSLRIEANIEVCFEGLGAFGRRPIDFQASSSLLTDEKAPADPAIT
jgi:hypothetical protein